MKEEFILRKRKMYPLSREEREDVQVHIQTTKKEVYQTLKITSNSTSILCRKEG